MELKLSMFGFEALWSPIFLVWMIFVIISYFFMISVFKKKQMDNVSRKQQIYFVLGASLIYLLLGGPADLLAHILFSAHMMQMAGVYLVAVPLVILGLPQWMQRPLARNKWWKAFTHPLLAILLFNVLFSLYHLPIIFDTIKTSKLLHTSAHTVLFVTSFMMWWPLLNSLAEAQTLSPLKKIGYVFANGILLTPACALIIFSHEALYTTYTNPQAWATAMQLCVPSELFQSLNISGPYFFQGITALEDQQLGGVLMKIMQEIVYGVCIGYVFYHWMKEEKRQPKIIENPYQPT